MMLTRRSCFNASRELRKRSNGRSASPMQAYLLIIAAVLKMRSPFAASRWAVKPFTIAVT